MDDLTPKSDATIRAEMRVIRRALEQRGLTERERGELYGAQQALAWARGENAMRPSVVAIAGRAAAPAPARPEEERDA